MHRRDALRTVGTAGALGVAGLLGAVVSGGSGRETGSRDDGDHAAFGGTRSSEEPTPLTVAAATTVHDSGLFASLARGFEDRTGTAVHGIVRGTAGALAVARQGDCDAVVAHAPELEAAFLADGHGTARLPFMVNDFLLVGPRSDPATVADTDPATALSRIAAAGETFLSRGDGSGTHQRELRLAEAAGVEISGDWRRENGQGMGSTLVMAGQLGAYTLTDRGSYLAVDHDGLTVHIKGGIDDPRPVLRNEYSLIVTNPERHDVAADAVGAFGDYLTGDGADRIEAFRIDGSRAFRPTSERNGA